MIKCKCCREILNLELEKNELIKKDIKKLEKQLKNLIENNDK